VVDVDTNPRSPVIGDRAFGDDPDLVGRLGAALIRGLEGGGVAACAKHFPGHGDTDVDSHDDLPAVDHPRSRLDAVELPPFRKAVTAGVASVMTAHLVVREIDALPATLSSRLLAVLRRDLAFDGVVVADDLEMKAISTRWPPGRAAVLAMTAGCDVLPVGSHVDAQVEALEAAIRAAEAGEVGFAAMDDALRRIRRLKQRFLLPYRDPVPRLARLAAGAAERVALAQEITERSGIAV
jgi:beta-N-acetylhexosaminidase